MDQLNDTWQTDETAKTLGQSITAAHFQQDWRLSARNPGTNDRLPFRVKLPDPATSENSPDQRIEGELYNLSARGCSIRLSFGVLCPGDGVWFRIDTIIPWKGTVRWANAVNVGVEFERPLFQSQFELVSEMRKDAAFSRANHVADLQTG